MQNSIICLCAALLAGPVILSADTTSVNDWYWNAITVLHNDNHCSLIAKGHSEEEIYSWVKDIPVSSVQVSAYGATGDRITYPSKSIAELNYPDLNGWDSLDIWKKATQKAGKRFHVYINTRGFKIHNKHPAWMQRNAEGKGKGRGPGLYDSCPRPSIDGDGYLENILLPMIKEISENYSPGAFWVDGDHARTQTCYCKNCVAAWKELTAKEKPPTSAKDPDWPKWLELEQKRYDSYREIMAAEAHKHNPGVMYASNHSWHKIMGANTEKHDPRSAPDQMDYYTADLSHGNALKQTRVYAMSLSAEEETPYDIMHSIYSPSATLPRIMQQGAIALSCGGVWNLWLSGSTITTQAARDRAMFCAKFADIRKDALGRTFSINPVAVLISESSWLKERAGGRTGLYDPETPKNAALGLQDSGYGVDIINEHMLLRGLSRYKVLLIANTYKLPESVILEIESFIYAGGTVMRSAGSSSIKGKSDRIIEVDLQSVRYPDFDGAMAKYMRSAGFGPSLRIPGKGETPHLICALRRRGNKTILHLTDITSFSGGKKILPDRTENIDPVFHTHKSLTIEVACPVKPTSVAATGIKSLSYKWKSRVPWLAKSEKEFSATLPPTKVSYSWNEGILRINLENFTTHTALIIDSLWEIPTFLPEDTPLEQRLACAHYSSLNVIERLTAKKNKHYNSD